MPTIRRTSRFKKDFKREAKGRHGAVLEDELRLPVGDAPLPPRHRDHTLGGEWSDHRDCHVKPDLLLIHRKPDDTSIELVRMGSHSELGL